MLMQNTFLVKKGDITVYIWLLNLCAFIKPRNAQNLNIPIKTGNINTLDLKKKALMSNIFL